MMTAKFSRREALRRTAAAAAASLSPGVRFAGAAVPLRALSRSGEIDAILQAGVDAGEAAKMSEDTVFRIASMIKLLTSVAAMQLVERGKLRLHEPAARIDPTLGS